MRVPLQPRSSVVIRCIVVGDEDENRTTEVGHFMISESSKTT